MEPWITEPGTYDLSEADYHADMVIGGSLSSTGARRLATSTPAHFHWECTHGRTDTRTFDFGRAAHREVLGEGGDVVVIEGTGKGGPNSWTTDAVKAEVQTARAAGLTPVKPAEAETIAAMAAALRAHPVAGPLLARPGKAEQSLIARDPESGVMCRVRIDWLPDVVPGARALAVDYKTTADASPAGFALSMGKFGYHQQGPFYGDALLWLGLGQAEDVQFVLVAQEKDPPYLVTVGWPDEPAIEWGRRLNRKARHLYRRCTESGEWPGYPLEPVAFALPGWLERQYEQADAAGLYDVLEDA